MNTLFFFFFLTAADKISSCFLLRKSCKSMNEHDGVTFLQMGSVWHAAP